MPTVGTVDSLSAFYCTPRGRTVNDAGGGPPVPQGSIDTALSASTIRVPMVNIADLIERHGRGVDAFLDAEFPPDRIPYISEGVRYQLSTGGKRLRPALCLIACEALEGDPADALPFAAATEVLHNFFLVHDDIEDGDRVRRDHPTLWVKFGLANGINIGDYLIAACFRLILSAPLPPEANLKLLRLFTLAFERTVEGQALDINLRGSRDVSLETYRRIVVLKTGYYLALPWVGGAVIAGASEEALEGLWELGKCLGPAFQIRDDIIDLTQGKGRGGEIGCDLKEGKPSIFFAYSLEREAGSREERERLVEIVAKPREETADEEVAWAIEFYRRHGAIEFAEAEAARYIDRAQTVIEELPFGAAGKETFRAIGRYMIDRTK